MTTSQFADMLGKDIFVNELYKQFGELKRNLSPAQERQLLSWHAKHDFEYPMANVRETMRVLLDKGYLKEYGKRLDVTAKGKEYLDEHSFDIRSAGKPKSKEMTPTKKAELQKELERLDALVKESKKKIAEKGGQMTLFGKVILGAWSSPQQREYERIYNDLYLKSEKAAEALGKKGYDWYQINKYVESLAVSLTPDSFGHKGKLNRGQSKFLQDLEQAYKPKTIPESKGQMTLFGKIKPYFKGDTNDVWWIDDEPQYNERQKGWFHKVFNWKHGRYLPAQIQISEESLRKQFLPGEKETKKEKIIPERKGQMTLFGRIIAGKLGAFTQEGPKAKGVYGSIDGAIPESVVTGTGLKIWNRERVYGNDGGFVDLIRGSIGENSPEAVRIHERLRKRQGNLNSVDFWAFSEGGQENFTYKITSPTYVGPEKTQELSKYDRDEIVKSIYQFGPKAYGDIIDDAKEIDKLKYRSPEYRDARDNLRISIEAIAKERKASIRKALETNQSLSLKEIADNWLKPLGPTEKRVSKPEPEVLIPLPKKQKKHTIPEQADFIFPSQMTLFGRIIARTLAMQRKG